MSDFKQRQMQSHFAIPKKIKIIPLSSACFVWLLVVVSCLIHVYSMLHRDNISIGGFISAERMSCAKYTWQYLIVSVPYRRRIETWTNSLSCTDDKQLHVRSNGRAVYTIWRIAMEAFQIGCSKWCISCYLYWLLGFQEWYENPVSGLGSFQSITIFD